MYVMPATCTVYLHVPDLHTRVRRVPPRVVRILCLYVLPEWCFRCTPEPVQFLQLQSGRELYARYKLGLVQFVILLFHGFRLHLGRILLLSPIRVQYLRHRRLVVLHTRSFVRRHAWRVLSLP